MHYSEMKWGTTRMSFITKRSSAHLARRPQASSSRLLRPVVRMRAIASVLCFAGICALATPAGAEVEAPMAMRSLDEQVQEIKSDVLAIAAELGNLEERLLYPSNTQVAVFVSFDEGQTVGLDSARISIDGEVVAQHIYSFKELEALQKGGVQRIFTGNVRTGKHRIEVAVAGKRPGGQEFTATESFVFEKAVDPKLVGIQLASESSGDAKIAIKEW